MPPVDTVFRRLAAAGRPKWRWQPEERRPADARLPDDGLQDGRLQVTDRRDRRDPIARLLALADPDSLRLTAGGPDGDAVGVVAGTFRMHGVPAVGFATDPAVQGGALSGAGCTVITEAYRRAVAAGQPIVGVWHSGGARLADGVASLDGVGRVFAAMTAASGLVPQLSLVVGPAAGGAAYGPALTDVVVLAPGGRIFVTGPEVVRTVTGEDVDMLRLGGPEPHGRRSGLAHVVAASDDEAVAAIRRVASLLGRPGRVGPLAERSFAGLLPGNPRRAYDVHPIVDTLLDEPGVELHRRWAPNVVTVWGRLGGRTVGVVANNPLRLGGCLDAASAEKAARFVRSCDAFGVPIVVVVDVPGYLPGVDQEWNGVVRRGAKLLHAFAECVVPRVTLVVRKAYGGAYIAMNSRSLGATRVLAWPSAEIAVMGAPAAVRILHRRRLAEAAEHARPALEAELAADHTRRAGGLRRAIDLGVVDAVVDPEATRGAVAAAVREAEAHLAGAGAPVRGAHRNIPL
jgi:acetyl-CoA/propionyl-CoA carboxylase carboxyl transferase subunit